MSHDIQFSIARSAKYKILSLTAEYKSSFDRDAIAAILWLDSNLNDDMVESRPTIGFYDNRDEISGDIVVIDGLEVVIAISEQDRDHFEGKTLDYENGRFVLK